MRRWLRRLLYLLIFLVWLLVMSFPAFAFFLANQGQIQLGGQEQQVRIFLLQDPGTEGIGWQWTRPFRHGQSCTRTTVRYLMWRGEAENVSFCQCYDPFTGHLLPAELYSCD